MSARCWRWLPLAVLACAACGSSELGECDPEAAEQLVYSELGMVATKGQALTHDSCGNGVFCHSATASGAERKGAPAELDFDMLPSPKGLAQLIDHADDAWQAVQDDAMPPRGEGKRVVGDGGWTTDVQGRDGAAALPSIATPEGKAVFRNWLACGAPTVTDSAVPSWARPPRDPFMPGETPAWDDIYDAILAPRCALGGCHNAMGAAGGLAMADRCATHAALFGSGACSAAYVRASDADGSLLIEKVDEDAPSCGGPMPPPSHGGKLAEPLRAALRAWIDSGALAEGCP